MGVKTPAIKPGLPVGEEQGVQRWPSSGGDEERQERWASVPLRHQDQSDTQDLTQEVSTRWGFKNVNSSRLLPR